MNHEQLIRHSRIELTTKHICDLLDPDLGATTARIEGPTNALLAELTTLSRGLLYSPAKQLVTGVSQNFLRVDKFEHEDLWHKLANKIAAELSENFFLLNRQKLLSSKLHFDDLALQHYPQSGPDDVYGISPHRDQSGFVNLVVVLLIYGPASFYICKDKSGAGAVEIKAKPGDLIIMRGGEFGKGIGEFSRPCHFVGRVDDCRGRLSFGMRQVTQDPVGAERLRSIYEGQGGALAGSKL